MPKIKGGARTGSSLMTIRYIGKEADREETGTHNLVSAYDNAKDMAKEFKENESKRGTRSYYHDHVSFHPKDRDKCTPEFMREFAEGYINQTYDNQQVYWGVHREKDHVHAHFCISATNMDGSKLQLKNKDLGNRDQYVQSYAKERGMHHMDNLELKMRKKQEKIKQAKKERGTKSDKEICSEKIQKTINDPNVLTKEDFKKGLEREGVSISDRKTGVTFNNRNYRFKTLGYSRDAYQNERFKDYQSKNTKSIISDRQKERSVKDKLDRMSKKQDVSGLNKQGKIKGKTVEDFLKKSTRLLDKSTHDIDKDINR